MSAEKITKLQERKEKLLEAVEIAEKSKKQIIEFSQSLIPQLNSRKITREEYKEKLNKALKNRTAEQWLVYYDNYINRCKKQIDACDKQISSIRRKKVILSLVILTILVLIAVLISLFFFFQPNLLEDIGEKISSVFQPSEISEVSIILHDKKAVLSEYPLIQHQAVLGQPVKWEKSFIINKSTEFSLNLPADSENITLKKIENREEQNISSLSIEKKLFTGEIEVKVEKDEGEYKIEYETPSSEIAELEAEGRVIKKILIKGPDNVHYTNILSFTELPREFNKNEIEKLKLYEVKNNQRIETKFMAYDTNENGLLDYIEWLTPELSEAVFELVIEISRAEHLDPERNFISDIYEQVKALDGNWSEPIPAGHYVRVTFKQPLENTKDITIYPRIISGEPRIEVYEIDGEEKIAEFANLQSNEYNRILLTNLQNSQNIFDLRIIDGEIEIEHIIDPSIAQIYYFTGDSSGTDELSTEQGTKTAAWSTGINADWHYWILNSYSKNTFLTPQSPLVSFWCNNTGSIRGDKIQIDSINYFDCSDSSCATSTEICSTRSLNLNCDVNGPAININFSACTISSNYTLVAGHYLAVGFMAGIGKQVRLNVYFNSSQYPSSISMTEWTPDTTPPDVNIISPLNQTYFQSSIDFNFTLNEAGYCEYSLNNGETNYTMTANSSSTGFNATNTSIADGSYTVNAYCNDSSGNKNYTTATFNVSAVSFYPPRITYVSEIPPITPVEASSTAGNFYVTIYDSNGINNLNGSSVKASFIREKNERENACTWLNDIDLNSANFSCVIDMWYWDKAGIWNISIYAEDLNGNPAVNETTTFQYNLLKSIVISPSEIIWPEIIQGAKNQTPNIPTIINNTGNYNATGSIAIQAMNLHGETDSSEFIDAGNFAVDINPGESSCSGFSLINGTNITITNSILETGNLSAGSGAGQEQLYYCLKEVPLISSQTYSTQQAGRWIITVLIASVIIKKRKQKSKKLKNNLKKDNLLVSLNLLSKELRQNYSEEKEKIVKLLIKEIKKKYRINSDELSELVRTGKEDIPLEIFSKELGALESITKYMKENLGMSYHKISLLLNRDERTIWTAYYKSKKKQKEPIIIKEKKIFLPISAFNKELTILESVIVYLKKQGRMYSKIAKLLNRDQRNIWTIYSRAMEKIKSKV